MKKIWKIVIALVIVAVVFTGSVFGVKKCNEVAKEASTNGSEDCVVVTPESTPQVYSMPKSLTFTATTLTSDETEPQGIYLKATIVPETAYNCEVDWTLSWGDFAWENDFYSDDVLPTEFIRLTPIEDGSRTCLVECLKEFRVQIIITVTSRSDTSKSASCVVDYCLRITSAKLELSNGEKIIMGEVGDTESPVIHRSFVANTVGKNAISYKAVYPGRNSNDYTIEPDNYFIQLFVSSTYAFSSALDDYGFSLPSLLHGITLYSNYLSDVTKIYDEYAFSNTFCRNVFDCVKGDDKFVDLRDAIASVVDEPHLLFTLCISSFYNGTFLNDAFFYFYYTLDYESMLPVESVVLDSSLVF